MILSKPQMFLTKVDYNYEVCRRGNNCASAIPSSFKARYVILKALKKTGYVDRFVLFVKFVQYYTYKTFGNTKNSWIIILCIHIVMEYINTMLLMSKHNYIC